MIGPAITWITITVIPDIGPFKATVDGKKHSPGPPGFWAITRHHGVGEILGWVEMVPTSLPELPKPSGTQWKQQNPVCSEPEIVQKKIRQTKKSFQPSDFQKSQRDFAFVIDKIFKIGLLEKIIKEIDDSLIQEVTTFDVYESENIPKDKKSVAINVTLQSPNKTLSEKDLDQISKKIIDVVKEKTGAIIRS